VKLLPNASFFLVVGLLAGFALAVSVFSVPLGIRDGLRPIVAIIALEIGVVVAFVPFARQRFRPVRSEMGETPAWHLRFDTEAYWSMSEGQRQTYIGGALDMLCYSYQYTVPQYQQHIAQMDHYSGQLDVGEIKEKFEAYLESIEKKEKKSAASILVYALYEWSGLGD